MEPFRMAAHFPTRRRVTQACLLCRTRKTRCDAAQPRCGFCTANDVDRVYRDSQQPRIDHGTQVLLDRIQLLEDRITGPMYSAAQPANYPPHYQGERIIPSGGNEHDIRSCIADASQVYSWPIVTRLIVMNIDLSEQRRREVATDLFFQSPPRVAPEPVPLSWTLYSDASRVPNRDRHLITTYFDQVNVFFPLLTAKHVLGIHDAVLAEKSTVSGPGHGAVSVSEYALLLLVLCMACFVHQGQHLVELDIDPDYEGGHEQLSMWNEAKLLLGAISSDITLTTAQCNMLARLGGP